MRQDSRSDDSHDESNALQLARQMLSGANGGIVRTAAGVSAAIGKDGNGEEAADEADVEGDAEKGEESDAAEEAGEDDGEGGVDDCYA